jgi:GPH family glycoside/pentoside/hexuronide:cation symporter
LPFALAFAMLWWRPPWEEDLFLVAYYTLAYVVFDAAATVIYMPYFALTPELTSDYDERTSLTTYRMFFSIVGSLAAFTVPLTIVGTFHPDSSYRVWMMGLIFGVMSALPLLLVFFGIRERPAFMEQERPSLRQSLRAALRNRPFVFGLIIFLLTWVTVEILQATLLFFVKYVVQRDAQNDLVMATIFVTAVLALPIWDFISRRWSKRWAYAAGIAFWAVVQIGMITLGPGTDLGVLLAMCVLAGIGVSAAHVLPWAIIPDAIEWGEWQTGKRHEGMLYSLITLTKKATTSLAVPAVGLILQFTGYVPNAAQQPPSAVLGIRIAIGPIPAILLCTGILFALLYPLTRDEYADIARDLERRRRAESS